MAMFGHQFFSVLMQTLTADMCHSGEVGSVAGLAGLMHPAAFVVLLTLLGRIGPPGTSKATIAA